MYDALLCAATEMSYAEAERERASIVAKYRLVIEFTLYENYLVV